MNAETKNLRRQLRRDSRARGYGFAEILARVAAIDPAAILHYGRLKLPIDLAIRHLDDRPDLLTYHYELWETFSRTAEPNELAFNGSVPYDYLTSGQGAYAIVVYSGSDV